MKKPTIADVALLAGVAKSTVSAVINNRDVVAPDTRRRVQKAVKELQFRPRAAARQRLPHFQRRTLGFVIKEAGNPYYTDVLKGIDAAARARGYDTLVSSSKGELETETRLVEMLCDMGVAGLLLTPIVHQDLDMAHIFELRQGNVPFVLLEKVPGSSTNLVDIDNVLASCMAVEHLFALGHEQVIHFAGPVYSEHSEERISGVRRAFSESHLRFDPACVVRAGGALEEGYSAARAFFGTPGHKHVTAVTCYNDLVALGVLKALAELGLRVPEDISVVGFDNVSLLDYLTVPLTTVNVPRYEMGARAAEMLIGQIEKPEGAAVEKVTLDATLVVRQTTAPPAASA